MFGELLLSRCRLIESQEETHENHTYKTSTAIQDSMSGEGVVKELGIEYPDWATGRLGDGRKVTANIISREDGLYDINIVIDPSRQNL